MVTFNLFRVNGDFVGYAEVEKLAGEKKKFGRERDDCIHGAGKKGPYKTAHTIVNRFFLLCVCYLMRADVALSLPLLPKQNRKLWFFFSLQFLQLKQNVTMEIIKTTHYFASLVLTAGS